MKTRLYDLREKASERGKMFWMKNKMKTHIIYDMKLNLDRENGFASLIR